MILIRSILRFANNLYPFSARLSFSVLLSALLFISSPAFCFSEKQPQPKLKVYQAPQGAILNNTFSVKVRSAGGEWQRIPTYLVKVDHVVDGMHREEQASMSNFDFAGEVEVAVTLAKGDAKAARIRPLSYNMVQDLRGSTVFFKLVKPSNISIEFNGDIFHNLHLFANPIESFVPDRKNKNLIYFGPGIHEIDGGKFKIPSNKTVYVHGEAVLKGQLLVENARNVRILGRGMVDQAVKMGIKIANSRNVFVSGLFSTQCLTGGSDSVTIRNVKTISYFGWGDGMNIMASNNVLIDSVFNRNSDDCSTVYGTRHGFKGGSRNIVFQNSVLWADVAHPILIGTHGSTPSPEILENITYNNLDILDHKEAQLDYQGCFAINAGDSNLIRKVRFENIRVEDFRQGQLLNLRVFYNKKYCTSPGRGIENVLFKNITYSGSNSVTSIICGYDKDRTIRDIVFENLTINGLLISDDMKKPAWYKTSDIAGFYVGDHVEGITFIRTK
ncbi:glycosyl hydrolase family 28 protein [Desertivirga arenae]|uniref:glycosyl hydrolase family 28 protein n=1 Tax=Desertivirga arenae TaxID=2810309 RepID=UPI001A9750C5|nr:glycosyl hydrolase family 28 protein [Pedobacter sp. SYSU D00823]